MTHKKCGNCFKIKPISEFYHKRGKDLYQWDCKPCHSRSCVEYQRRVSREKSRNYAKQMSGLTGIHKEPVSKAFRSTYFPEGRNLKSLED